MYDITASTLITKTKKPRTLNIAIKNFNTDFFLDESPDRRINHLDVSTSAAPIKAPPSPPIINPTTEKII